MGYIHHIGFKVSKNISLSILELKKAVELGSIKAISALYWIYNNGINLKKDSKKSMTWGKKLISTSSKEALLGNDYAQYILGVIYISKEIIPEDRKKAFYWLEKAALQNNINAINMLGHLYLDDGKVDKTIELFKQAFSLGHVKSATDLATIYADEASGKKDFKNAFFWYTKAAELNDPYAQNGLGVLFRRGEGVKQDFKKMLYWYTKAAENGLDLAQCNLGEKYFLGVGVKKDFNLAKKWITLAANQGYARCQYYLGLMYYEPANDNPDYQKAFQWFSLAAEQNYIDAQYILGLLYFEGKGASQNYRKAKKWWQIAAQEGNKEAQFYLGEIYFQGYGVKENYKTAREWWLSRQTKSQCRPSSFRSHV